MATAKPGVISNWDLVEEQVQFYRRHLDTFIIEQFPPITLTQQQRLIVRAIGNNRECAVVCHRSFGKTLVTALAAFGLCVLYPGTEIAVCSATAAQATLILGKLKSYAERNPNIAAELDASSARNLVRISKESSICEFKNGSRIQSYPLNSMRGLRAKVVIVDEAPMIDKELLDAVVRPLMSHVRPICIDYNFDDFDSKIISITSACEKSNGFYSDFVRIARNMAQGKEGSFACAFDWKASVRVGMKKQQYFEDERLRMSSTVFDMEYGSIFAGAADGAFFPYDLVQACRTLKKVEIEQPKNSKSRYVISLDIATSMANDADNAIFTVIKFTEKADGSFSKKVVFIKSFHGNSLDVLANEMRKIYHMQFPNAERLIYDARGLGDSFARFMDSDWTDPETGKEYPPLVDDDKPVVSATAKPVLHPVRAVQQMNQRMANNLRTMLEQRSIELPISERVFRAEAAEEDSDKLKNMKEYAVYLETDALQIEMGNIVQKVTASGNYIYDTPRHSLHKDRYSSLAMGCDYVAMLEEESINRQKRGEICVGLDPTFY